VPVCRGCVYNCATCGGSAYSYRTYLGRERPGFRSPAKITEDLQKLAEQKVRLVFLFQDPRMGGPKYQSELDSFTMELFTPADQEYARDLSTLGFHVTLTISPESGEDGTRSYHGRNYTNEALLRTVDNCKKYDLSLMVFFMAGLANETRSTMEETWKLWEKIYAVAEKDSVETGALAAIHSFGPMVLLDPGSLAFDFPDRHGYRLVSKNLEDYVSAMALPSWHQWISYETRGMDRAAIVSLILDSIEKSMELYEEHGVYDRPRAARERRRHVDANRWIVEQVDLAMQAGSEEARRTALERLEASLLRYGVKA
jgi:radical SAM superfamily enzyme YgiQ (UPF0313 family)